AGDAGARPARADLVARQDGRFRRAGQRRVERLEEGLARSRVVLPRILAVESDGDESVVPGRRDAADEIGGRRSGRGPGVAESDQVGKLAIAEEDADLVVRSRDIAA